MNTFTILKYKAKSFEPETILREVDGLWFTIGDRVTNGTKMQGKITHFEIGGETKASPELFVYTDWSGVGMNLDSVSYVKKEEKKTTELPSALQIDQVAHLVISTTPPIKVPVTIRGVHFYKGKIRYDADIWLADDESVRLYNIESQYLIKA